MCDSSTQTDYAGDNKERRSIKNDKPHSALLPAPPAMTVDPSDGKFGQGGIDRTPVGQELKLFSPPGDATDSWRTAVAIYYNNDDGLEILSRCVVERWQELYMTRLADAISKEGGTVLEIGFGLGMSARRIQEHKVSKHVIIESNLGVQGRIQGLIRNQKLRATLKCGTWQDVVQQFPDAHFDGILYHGCHVRDSELHTHHAEFIVRHASRLLKPGGVLTYTNIHSWGEHLKASSTDLPTVFRDNEIPFILEAGFIEGNIRFEMVEVQPPADCTYYNHHQLLVPIITKHGATVQVGSQVG